MESEKKVDIISAIGSTEEEAIESAIQACSKKGSYSGVNEETITVKSSDGGTIVHAECE